MVTGTELFEMDSLVPVCRVMGPPWIRLVPACPTDESSQAVRERGTPGTESRSPCDSFMICEPTAGRELSLRM